MSNSIRLPVGVSAAIAVLALSATVQAQTPATPSSQPVASSLGELSILTGARIEVTRVDGSTITGLLSQASEDMLAVEPTREKRSSCRCKR